MHSHTGEMPPQNSKDGTDFWCVDIEVESEVKVGLWDTALW